MVLFYYNYQAFGLSGIKNIIDLLVGLYVHSALIILLIDERLYFVTTWMMLEVGIDVDYGS